MGGEPCQWALTQKRTLWGGGALQLLDLRLLEDGGERGGALDSDVVAPETASEGQDWNGERVGVSMGADTKATTPLCGGALEVGDHSLLENGSEHGGALSSEAAVPDTARGGCGGTVRGRVRVSGH